MRLRAALLTLAVLVAAAATPAAASANLSPAVTVDESAGNAAATASSVKFTLRFNPTPGDEVTDVTINFPPGLLIDEEIDGGACLSVTRPTPACEIGSGTATIGATSEAMAVYLVAPPTPSALAGVELVAPSISAVAQLTLRSTSALQIQPSLYAREELAFTALSATPVAAMSFTLNQLTLPSSCQPTIIGLWAASQQEPFAQFVSAPFTVSACGDVPYEPAASERISRDHGSTAGTFVVNFTIPPGDSDTQHAKIQVPANLSLNQRLSSCLQGIACTVGTVTATSPVLPAAQLQGVLTLSGNVRAPTLNAAFGAPLGVQLSSTWASGAITLSFLPDIPLSTFTMNFTGTKQGRMFVIECYPNSFGVTFTPRSGNSPVNVTGPVTQAGCPASARHRPQGRPTGSVSVSGRASRAPRLVLHVKKGKNAPGIRSVSIRPASGLRFLAHVPPGSLSLSPAKLARVRIRSGTLVVTFKRAVGRSTLKLEGPLVAENSVHPLRMTVRVTDASGRQTLLKLLVKGS